MTFLELVEKVLIESDKPLHYKQVWNNATEKDYDKQLPKPTQGQRLTPWDTINAQLSVNIRKEDTIFIRTSKGYYWIKEKADKINIEQLTKLEEKSEQASDKATGLDKKKEKDLHAPLAQYIYQTHSIYTKTINANAVNSKSGEMKWGTPDMVGVLFLEYDPILQNFCTKLSISNVELQAFELKLKLNASNITEYFFQTLSNSSWANEAWLVALEIQSDDKFHNELERLNQSFGVGILLLNDEIPEESKVLFPAKKRANLDLDTMNKLMQNSEFKDFINHINDAISSPNPHERLKEKIKLGNFDNPNI